MSARAHTQGECKALPTTLARLLLLQVLHRSNS
jgi:hypothetical protein